MNVVKELFSKQVPYIYQFDPASIYNLSRGKTCFRNNISEYFAVLLANKQIQMFGVTRRQALISAYLLSSGFRMVCHRYPELFSQLDSSSSLDITNLKLDWYFDNGYERGSWFYIIAQSSVEVNFKRIDMPYEHQPYRDKLEYLAREYSQVWNIKRGRPIYAPRGVDDIHNPLDRYGYIYPSRVIPPRDPQLRYAVKVLLRPNPIREADIGFPY